MVTRYKFFSFFIFLFSIASMNAMDQDPRDGFDGNFKSLWSEFAETKDAPSHDAYSHFDFAELEAFSSCRTPESFNDKCDEIKRLVGRRDQGKHEGREEITRYLNSLESSEYYADHALYRRLTPLFEQAECGELSDEQLEIGVHEALDHVHDYLVVVRGLLTDEYKQGDQAQSNEVRLPSSPRYESSPFESPREQARAARQKARYEQARDQERKKRNEALRRIQELRTNNQSPAASSSSDSN